MTFWTSSASLRLVLEAIPAVAPVAVPPPVVCVASASETRVAVPPPTASVASQPDADVAGDVSASRPDPNAAIRPDAGERPVTGLRALLEQHFPGCTSITVRTRDVEEPDLEVTVVHVFVAMPIDDALDRLSDLLCGPIPEGGLPVVELHAQ
jgi:hypothetical protein